MTDERLMRDLGKALRRREEGQPTWLDDRWERLAAGTLPPQERAELAALAERSEEARRLWEMCQPLPSELRGRIAQRIVEPAPDAAPQPARTKAEGRFHGRAWWWAPAAVAAASVAAVMMLWPGRAAAPLPEYSAHLAGGVRAQRSPDSPPAVPVFQPGTRFELTLRPGTRVEGRLEVRAFLESGERFEPWLAREVPPDTGAVTLDGVVGEDIELRPGTWSLRVVVARPGAMPEAGALRAQLSQEVTAGPGWVAAAPMELRMKP